MSNNGKVTVLAVGDVCVNRDEPDSIFTHVDSAIQEADISFCQLETIYSKRGNPMPQGRVPLRADKNNVGAIKRAGFDIVSFASNHLLDWGQDALFDTIDAVTEQGIPVIGAGRNMAEARKPEIMVCEGTKIAFLAYNSILPMGYWADINRPGCAPLRAWTLYEQVEHDQPGTPARIHTFAHEEDKAALLEDVRNAKAKADIVMLSIHWGIHFKEAEIANYQREVAYAAIEAGADCILGHHAHILKPIEVYKGKPIFYSLCNFAFDLPLPDHVLEGEKWKELMALNPSWTIDKSYRSYPFPVDSRMTIACKMEIEEGHLRAVHILPAFVNENSQPRLLNQDEREFHDVIAYIEKINGIENIDTRFRIEGNEVVVVT